MFATSLIILFIDSYGTEALTWDPATIEMEIKQDSGVDLSLDNFDRLLTAISLLNSNRFYQSPVDFSRACVVLSGHHVPTDQMILPDAGDLAWGLTEGMLICPPEDDDSKPFTAEILGLVGEVLKDEGILNPPDILRIGLRDKNLMANVSYDFSDDPEMFSAINKEEQSKTDDINKLVRGRLRSLILQMQKLPLRNGNVEAVAKKLLAGLPKSEEMPLPS